MEEDSIKVCRCPNLLTPWRVLQTTVACGLGDHPMVHIKYSSTIHDRQTMFLKVSAPVVEPSENHIKTSVPVQVIAVPCHVGQVATVLCNFSM